MNDMRKLMEAVQQVNEGWDPEGIAQAIYDDYQEGGSALELAAANSPEPYRAMVYEFGNLTGLYNAESLDGSQIWHQIIDKLEELFAVEEAYQGGKAAVKEISEHGRWVDPPNVGDQFIHYDSGYLTTVIKVGKTHVILRDDETGQEVKESFVDEYDGLYSDAYKPVVGEAYQGGKTEHSGAKKGKGAFYGRKKEAKRDSNKNRRRADKAAINEEPGDWDHGYNYEGPQADDDDDNDEDLYLYKDNYNKGYIPDEDDDEPRAKKYTRHYGNVTVDFDHDEVLITHGHGENIFLTMAEWKEFAGEIQDIML